MTNWEFANESGGVPDSGELSPEYRAQQLGIKVAKRLIFLARSRDEAFGWPGKLLPNKTPVRFIDGSTDGVDNAQFMPVTLRAKITTDEEKERTLHLDVHGRRPTAFWSDPPIGPTPLGVSELGYDAPSMTISNQGGPLEPSKTAWLQRGVITIGQDTDPNQLVGDLQIAAHALHPLRRVDNT